MTRERTNFYRIADALIDALGQRGLTFSNAEHCPHDKDPDQCLICWAEWNIEIEKIRIESRLTRREFTESVRDWLKRRSK